MALRPLRALLLAVQHARQALGSDPSISVSGATWLGTENGWIFIDFR